MNNLRLYEEIINSTNSAQKIILLKKFKELCELESELHMIRSENKSNKRKINHKKFVILCKKVVPYIASISTALGLMTFTEHTPFVMDKKKYVIEETKNYSTNGTNVTRDNILYKDFVYGVSTLYVYGDWEKTDDGYQRSYKEYHIKSLDENEILDLIHNYPNVDIKLDPPINSGFIYSDRIYDDSNVMIETHDILDGTTIRITEKIPSNIIDSGIFLVVLAFIIYSVCEYNKSVDYRKVLEEVKQMYTITDTAELEEQVKKLGEELEQSLGQKKNKK